jgi:hypothetical protein
MAKFHINPKTGDPGACSATNGKCPFGGAEDHFTSVEAARAASEQQLSEANGWSKVKREPTPLSDDVKKLIKEIENLENSPSRHNYGFPEDEMTRSHIEGSIRTKKAELSELIENSDFVHLRNSLSNEDVVRAVSDVAVRTANTDKSISWDNVMKGARRTANAMQKYTAYTRNVVRSRPELQQDIDNLAKKHRDQEVFARSFEQGYPIPKQYAEAFEAAWADPKTGERHLKSELRSLKATEAEYNSGSLSATKVVGGGLRNPKAEAERYFKTREAELTRAIATRGRSYPVTVSNVYYRARQEGWPFAN